MNIDLQWNPMPNDLRLSHDHIDLWLVPLEQSAEAVERYTTYLAEDERRAASRFRMADKTNESVITRGAVREHLALVLDAQPNELVFAYHSHGKPYLAGKHKNAGVCFNVSHSGKFALIAATMNRTIGVDIERIRESVECGKLAQRFFSKNETADLLSLPVEQQRRAFFTCWTRKEAFVKALGKGIMMGLEQFDVSLLPDVPAGLLDVRFEGISAADWSIDSIPINDQYLAAIAVEGHDYSLRTWQSSDKS